MVSVGAERTFVTGRGDVGICAKNVDDIAAVVTQCRYAGGNSSGVAYTNFQREEAHILDV